MEHILMLGGDRERFQVQMAGLVPNEDDWIPGSTMKSPANLTRAQEQEIGEGGTPIGAKIQKDYFRLDGDSPGAYVPHQFSLV